MTASKNTAIIIRNDMIFLCQDSIKPESSVNGHQIIHSRKGTIGYLLIAGTITFFGSF